MEYLFLLYALLITSGIFVCIGIVLVAWSVRKIRVARKKYSSISHPPNSWNIWFLLILGGIFILQGIFALGSFLLVNI